MPSTTLKLIFASRRGAPAPSAHPCTTLTQNMRSSCSSSPNISILRHISRPCSLSHPLDFRPRFCSRCIFLCIPLVPLVLVPSIVLDVDIPMTFGRWAWAPGNLHLCRSPCPRRPPAGAGNPRPGSPPREPSPGSAAARPGACAAHRSATPCADRRTGTPDPARAGVSPRFTPPARSASRAPAGSRSCRGPRP